MNEIATHEQIKFCLNENLSPISLSLKHLAQTSQKVKQREIQSKHVNLSNRKDLIADEAPK